MFMASRKDKDLKDFLITERKKTSAGITVAPVWVMQKADKRLYNTRQSRHWSDTDFGKRYRKMKKKEGKK